MSVFAETEAPRANLRVRLGFEQGAQQRQDEGWSCRLHIGLPGFFQV